MAYDSAPLTAFRKEAEEGSRLPLLGSKLEPFVYCSSSESPECGNNNEPLDKRAAVVILGELLKRGRTAQSAWAS